ncbi:uncharacterized protein A4U43_C03F14270 [Asparagus officinalis]|uniref:Protein kinase domain-containing protein n=1 Tax=Asparagus officinalis TaxID=4686 RepID=A0A5P1FCS8_ASPOF|nr:casein kinase 1-like protein 4 isoform X2 [Asparagus officinalis]ONK75187.1 uncharacterized protein A4U43_C03F14270 [Asparagus officinalis]
MGRVVGGKYKLGEKIRSGSFSEVYRATHVDTSELVAVKIENNKTEHPKLLHEAKIYSILNGESGFANIKWFGVDGENNVLVLDLLGPSLEELLAFCGGKFTLKTVLMLADQMITRLEYVHSKGFLHGDIRPDKFLMGLGQKENQVHMIDFGLAKRYRDYCIGPYREEIIPVRYDQKLTCCPTFASGYSHAGFEQGRRDDLESLGYVLLYFLRGRLPWQGLKAATEEKRNKMMCKRKLCKIKLSSPVEVMYPPYPEELGHYLAYCQFLECYEQPAYGYLKGIFRDFLTRQGYKFDYVYDWTVLEYERNQRPSAAPVGPYRRAKPVKERDEVAAHMGPSNAVNHPVWMQKSSADGRLNFGDQHLEEEALLSYGCKNKNV